MTTSQSSTGQKRLIRRRSSAARVYWHSAYRLQRIARREAMKAFVDCLTFGSGFVMIMMLATRTMI